MSFAYTKAKADFLKGLIALQTDDIRALLVMTNTTADTEEDVATIGAFTTLDEFNGSGYSAGGLAFTGEAVSQDDPNNRGEFISNTPTFSAIGAGTRQIQAMLIYKFVSSVSASQPLFFIDTGGFPIAANGGDVAVQPNAEGWVQTT